MDASYGTMFLDAKKEYTRRLVQMVEPYVIDLFDVIYLAGASEGTPLISFQSKLRAVPEWNTHQIAEHTNQIRVICDCLSELIAAIFVSHVKVLSCIRISNKHRPNIRMRIPSDETFVHRFLIEYARLVYTDPTIFKTNDRSRKAAYLPIALDDAVGKLLPHKDILRACLGSYLDPEPQLDIDEPAFKSDDEDDDDEEPGIDDAPVSFAPYAGHVEESKGDDLPMPDDNNQPRVIDTDGQTSQVLQQPYTDTQVARAEESMHQEFHPTHMVPSVEHQQRLLFPDHEIADDIP